MHEDRQAPRPAHSARATGQAGHPGPAPAAGAQTAEQARIARLNSMGIPAAEAPEPAWSGAVFASTLPPLL